MPSMTFLTKLIFCSASAEAEVQWCKHGIELYLQISGAFVFHVMSFWQISTINDRSLIQYPRPCLREQQYGNSNTQQASRYHSMHQKQHNADLRVMCVELRTFVHVIWRRAALFSAAKPHFFFRLAYGEPYFFRRLSRIFSRLAAGG